jgi:arylsulfatase A-like enzyme
VTNRPNILIMVADDHRYESLGVHGNSEVATPHLDALAARGLVCHQAHCQGGMHGAICVPSRASLMTGRNIFTSAEDTIGRDYRASLTIPDSLTTFPERLRAAGYRTHAIGKWHNDAASFQRSFASAERVMFGGMSDHDRVPLHAYDPAGNYSPDACVYEAGFSTDLFAESAMRFLDEQTHGDPWLMYVAFTAPHDPRTPPAAFAVDPESVSVPPNFLPAHPFDNGDLLVRDEMLDDLPRTPASVRRHIADYYGMIQHLDAAIGQIVDAVARRSDAANTVIIYTADHGIALGQHGLLGKQNLYEHSTRIPLIMAGPGVPAGAVRNDLVWHGDTTATVMDLAGVDGSPALEGASLVATGGAPPRSMFAAAYRFSQRMIRDERYKLIRYWPEPSTAGTDTAGSKTAQLFDLLEDPWETTNLAHAPRLAPVIHRLDAALQAWQREVDDPLLALHAGYIET